MINEQTNTNIDINTAKIEIMKLFNDKIVKNHEDSEIEREIMHEFDKNYKERIFDYKVDIDELKMIINKLENNKSYGYAKVTNEMFKFGSHGKLLNLIALIFETIINHNVMPKNFNIGIVKLLVKDVKKDNSDINNLRPLTISDTLTNIFEKLLLKEILKKYKFKSKQFGFKSDSSCMHAVQTLKEIARYNKRKKKRLFIGAIDA
ncbi:unnamed protein product, partial [Brachionus calyciflorus]